MQKMGYVYDASTRTYRSSKTTGTKAISTVARTSAKVFSKTGSQVAPSASFYQSTTRVTISTAAQTKLASGVRTSLKDVLNAPVGATLPDSTVELTSGFASLSVLTAADQTKLTGLISTNSYNDKIKSFRLPTGSAAKLDLSAAQAIAPALLSRVDGNFSLELQPSEIRNSANALTLAKIRSAVGSRLNTFSIPGEETSFSATAASISALGPTVWAKYKGSLTVSDSIATVRQKETWNDLRVLNNFRNFSLNVPDGIPEQTSSTQSLSDFDLSLDYSSFISGYSLLKGINRQRLDANFTAIDQDGSLQSISLTGKLRNRDQFRMTLNKADGTPVTMTLSPLAITPAARTEDRIKILTTAIQEALKKDGTFTGVTVSSTNNKISISTAESVFSTAKAMSISLAEAGENDTTNFVDVTDVPIYGLPGLSNLPEIRSIAVKTSVDGLRSNWDSLVSFNAKTPLARINVDGSGDLILTSQEVKKYLPIIEKIAGRQIIVKDAPFAISTYSNFSEAAATKLATSVDLRGTVAEFMSGAAGIAALSNKGKLRSITLTDAGASTILLDSKAAISLSSSLGTLSQTAKIQITDKPSLADAAKLALSALATRLTGSFEVTTDGSDMTAINFDALNGISSKVSSVRVIGPLNLDQTMALTNQPYAIAAPIDVQDSAENLADLVAKKGVAGFSIRELNAIGTVSLSGSMTLSQAKDVNASTISNDLLSGLRVRDSVEELTTKVQDLVDLMRAGRLRSISTDDVVTPAFRALLDNKELLSFLI